MTLRELIRGIRARWIGLLLTSLLLGLIALLAPAALGASTTTKLAYVFDFGTGVSDTTGPPSRPGSSIFRNAITGSALPNGGTYNGVTFTNVPIATIDANPGTALSGFDTVLLYQVCSIGSHSVALGAINTFLANGGKVMIFDGDRCAPTGSGGDGVANWSGFLFPFSTSSPGPQGAGGSYTFVESSTLTTGLSVGAVPGDEVGDANVFTSAAGAWCTAVNATNTLGATGRVEAYARTASGGLAIYEGGDFWFTFGAASHLKLVFDNMLAQAFNPDGLPCTNPSSGIKLDPATATNPLGASHTVTATVVDINAKPLAGVLVTFKVVSGPDAGLTGTATTDSAGHASFTFTDTTAPGTDVVVASFTDSSGIVESSNKANKIWTKAPTKLTYNGATTRDFNDPATVSATLTSAVTNAPIPGATVAFALDADGTCSGTTDATGKASCQITPTLAAGAYPLTATFAGNANFLASNTQVNFVVTKEDTQLTSPTTLQVFAEGGSATLTSTLVDPANAAEGEASATPIASSAAIPITVKMTLTNNANSSSTQSCTGTTNASGVATCTISPVTVALGPATVTETFSDPTNHYQSATGNNQPALVFAFPASGDFVIGDNTAAGGNGTSVTFWSHSWAKENSLSGGAAPNAFKGFAHTTSPTPPTCGGTWTSRPGNSSGPPDAPLPAFMGVLVSSSVDKSGSTISGDIVHIVVVSTDPGYAPNPGHPGTGTIVATFC